MVRSKGLVEQATESARGLRLVRVICRFRIWDWFALIVSVAFLVWDYIDPGAPIWTVALSIYWIQRINNIDQEVSREEREKEHMSHHVEYDSSKLRILEEISAKMDRMK